MSMAAKLSDLGDKTSEANLQVEGQAEKPVQGAADWRETEEEDGSPLPNSPMWSPVQRLPLGCLNTKHCLEIQVTLTDELGDVPPPPHAWTCHQWWKICCKKPELDLLRQWSLAQVGQYFFMGDV